MFCWFRWRLFREGLQHQGAGTAECLDVADAAACAHDKVAHRRALRRVSVEAQLVSFAGQRIPVIQVADQRVEPAVILGRRLVNDIATR